MKIMTLWLWILAYVMVIGGGFLFFAAPHPTGWGYPWYPFLLLTPVVLAAVFLLRKNRPEVAGRIIAAWALYGWLGYLFEALGIFVPGNIYDQVWSLEAAGAQVIWGFLALTFVTLAWIYELIKPKTEFKLNARMIPICLVLFIIAFFYPGTPPELSSPLYGPCDTEVILMSMGVLLLFTPSVTALLGTMFYSASFFSHDLFALFTGLLPTWCEVFGHGTMSLSRLLGGGASEWVYADYLAWSVTLIAGSYFIYNYLKKNNLGIKWIFKTYWKLFAMAFVLALVIVIIK
jgi:hypothetical protein